MAAPPPFHLEVRAGFRCAAAIMEGTEGTVRRLPRQLSRDSRRKVTKAAMIQFPAPARQVESAAVVRLVSMGRMRTREISATSASRPMSQLRASQAPQAAAAEAAARL